MKRNNYVTSNFICGECGSIVPLPRNHGRQREYGHVKDIWCPGCKREMKFREITYKETYKTMSGDILV